MSSYARPTTDQIINRSGINTRMERYVQGDLVTSLTGLIPDAETRTALAVSEALFTAGDLTAFQAAALEIAVSCRVIADFLDRLADEAASRTYAPRERVDPAELMALSEKYELKAERYDRLAMGTGSDEGTQEGILPFLIAEGVDPNGLNLTPAGKLELLDERSNILAGRRFAW
jgi:hypothetical protein